ncbi:MAG: hypothetical protein WCA57_18555 [Ilumatobacteraceae bacterium]
MSRTRAALITAVVLVVLGIAASQFVPTQAAWNDSAFFTATASTGTWTGNGDISDGGISVGNTTTAITDIAWTVNSPTRFCVEVTVTGTSSTPQPWQLDVDLTRSPFNGVTVNDVTVQRGQKAQGPGNTMIVTGTMRPGRPFNPNNNNSPITDAQQALPRMCVTTATPALGDPSWYTVTVTQGTGRNWRARRACLTVTVTTTVTDLASNPFFYGWQTTLDLAPAFARITGAGGTPEAVTWSPGPSGGSNFTTVPTTYDPVQPTYAITSGPNLAIRGQGSGSETATLTACVRDYP